MEVQEPLLDAFPSIHLLRDLHPAVGADGEGSPVEELVVEGAQGHPVLLRVRASGLMPPDVRRLQRYQRISQADVEAADTAAESVRPEHVLSKRRVPWAARHRADLEVEADFSEDVLVHRAREVPLQDPLGDLTDEAGIRGEGLVDLLGEAAERGVLDEVAPAGIGPPLPDLARLRTRDLPEPVVLQAPERILGMVGSSGWAEFLEEPLEVGVGLLVEDEPGLPPAASGQRVEEEERFVGRPLSAPLPDGDVLDPPADLLGVHHRAHGSSSCVRTSSRTCRAAPGPGSEEPCEEMSMRLSSNTVAMDTGETVRG